jgi:hypothetical protein
MLTQEQLDHLFSFCKKHYVQYYDLQLELVDHLANAIEEKMKEDPKLSFESALDKVYAGFGITGFSKIVAARTASLDKTTSRLRWKLFLAYFTWPKVSMTLCMLVALSVLPLYLPGYSVLVLLVLLLIPLYIFETRMLRQINRQIKEQKLPLLVTQIGAERPFATLAIVFQFLIFFLNDKAFWNRAAGSIRPDYEMAVFMIVLFLASLLAYRDHAQKLLAHAQEEYPEAFATAE